MGQALYGALGGDSLAPCWSCSLGSCTGLYGAILADGPHLDGVAGVRRMHTKLGERVSFRKLFGLMLKRF